MNRNKAYRITTKPDDHPTDWTIYSAKSAGRAKTLCVRSMQSAYLEANYSWITSCRRCPEYDALAANDERCIAYKVGREGYEYNHEPNYWTER